MLSRTHALVMGRSCRRNWSTSPACRACGGLRAGSTALRKARSRASISVGLCATHRVLDRSSDHPARVGHLLSEVGVEVGQGGQSGAGCYSVCPDQRSRADSGRIPAASAITVQGTPVARAARTASARSWCALAICWVRSWIARIGRAIRRCRSHSVWQCCSTCSGARAYSVSGHSERR
jgi:hypothetical protein